jgi:hypothetical protein
LGFLCWFLLPFDVVFLRIYLWAAHIACCRPALISSITPYWLMTSQLNLSSYSLQPLGHLHSFVFFEQAVLLLLTVFMNIIFSFSMHFCTLLSWFAVSFLYLPGLEYAC